MSQCARILQHLQRGRTLTPIKPHPAWFLYRIATFWRGITSTQRARWYVREMMESAGNRRSSQ